MTGRKKFSFTDRASSFRFAVAGLAAFVRSEHNGWIHLATALVAIILGFALQISAGEWVSVVLCIALVFTTEILNTAIEKIMDHLSPDRHPAVKLIKDMAAGAVLVAAVASVVIALIIFIPKLL